MVIAGVYPPWPDSYYPDYLLLRHLRNKFSFLDVIPLFSHRLSQVVQDFGTIPTRLFVEFLTARFENRRGHILTAANFREDLRACARYGSRKAQIKYKGRKAKT